MKRHTQQVGVRKWAGGDLIELQAETLKALDGFLAQYGPCVVKGCEITSHESTFDVASGLVVLTGVDHLEQPATMIVPFRGASGVALPLYLTLAYTVRERAYADGRVKPIAYDYHAQASGVAPVDGVAHLTLTAEQTPRFVDVVQDPRHRFITDIERTVWNGKANLTHVNNIETALRTEFSSADTTTLAVAKADAHTKAEAALRSAKEYTDGRESAIVSGIETKDAATLVAAKSYAEQIVAALVDSSPEALNTLKELASALGGDPNFSTTVMQMIGERVTTGAMNSALAGKLSVAGGTINTIDVMTGTPHRMRIATSSITNEAWLGVVDSSGVCPGYLRIGPRKLQFYPDGDNAPARDVYHSGNTSQNLASPDAPGFMSDYDKSRLDNMPVIIAAGAVSFFGAPTVHKGWFDVSHANGSDTYTINTNNVTDFSKCSIQLTPLNGDRIVYLESKGSGTFTVRGTSLAATGKECGFEFVIIKY